MPGEIRRRDSDRCTRRRAWLIRAGEIVAHQGARRLSSRLRCDQCRRGRAAAPIEAPRRQAVRADGARPRRVIRRYCTIAPRRGARRCSGAQAPIVLLRADGPERLPDAVAPGLSTCSASCCRPRRCTCLLLAGLDRPAGDDQRQPSDEPQVHRRRRGAGARSRGIADLRADARPRDRQPGRRFGRARRWPGAPRVLRRARGYAPAPIALPAGFEAAPRHPGDGRRAEGDVLPGQGRPGDPVAAPGRSRRRRRPSTITAGTWRSIASCSITRRRRWRRICIRNICRRSLRASCAAPAACR